MLYWETAGQDPSLGGAWPRGRELDGAMLEWAAIWTSFPKVVFSTTRAGRAGQCPPGLRRPGGGDRAVAAGQAQGDIAIGGATLAAQAAALGLIDEYRARVDPVLAGGGTPFSPTTSAG